VGFVVSLNLHRRHLTESQRATVAAKLANMLQGAQRGNQNAAKNEAANLPVGSITQAEAADLLNVSERSVNAAGKVLHRGDDELVHALERADVHPSFDGCWSCA